MAQRISHGFREIGPAGQARQVVLQPAMQFLDQWPATQLTNSPTHIRWLSAHPGLDLVELADARQDFARKR